MVRFLSPAQANPTDIIRALSRAIETIKAGKHDPHTAHERVKGMCAWSDVAARTEFVYTNAMASPQKDTYERLSRYVLSLYLDTWMTNEVDSLRLELYLDRFCVSSWLFNIISSGSWNGMIRRRGLIWWRTSGPLNDSSGSVQNN